jgi:hypothetical protein
MRSDHARPTGRRPRRRQHGQRRNYGKSNVKSPTPAGKTRRQESQSIWQRLLAFFMRGKSSRPPANKADCSGKRKGRGVRQHRRPECVAVNSPKLYVGNLSFEATESDLFDLFRGVGCVQNAEIVCHRDSQRSKGFAFVMMGSIEEALRAVEILHDEDFLGRKLVVSGAKSKNFENCR